jgi:hypothetical protein
MIITTTLLKAKEYGYEARALRRTGNYIVTINEKGKQVFTSKMLVNE